MTTPDAEPAPAALDDDQLISQRAALRAQLEQLPSHARKRTALARQHDALTSECDRRARARWHAAETQPAPTRQRNQADPARRQP